MHPRPFGGVLSLRGSRGVTKLPTIESSEAPIMGGKLWERTMFKIFVAFVVSFSIVGCTTMRVVNTGSATTISDSIESGDHVVGSTVKGESFDLKVVSVSQQTLEGIDKKNVKKTIPVSDIAKLSVEKVSGWKTGGATATAVVLAVAAVFIFGLSRIDDTLDDDR